MEILKENHNLLLINLLNKSIYLFYTSNFSFFLWFLDNFRPASRLWIILQGHTINKVWIHRRVHPNCIVLVSPLDGCSYQLRAASHDALKMLGDQQ